MKYKTMCSAPESYGLEKAREIFRKGLLWAEFNVFETDKPNIYNVGNKTGMISGIILEIKKGRISVKREVRS
mgnify:CR=1 FL=1